ncbi:nonaspanin (TM9SF), Major facilitator superfamily domain protein [Artemisia annua]|uniref:Nonaspanin (TM9SF), Major facilitator superfamily domain protein n=1 Tax=Artemisia annua TaxID=35608 RepID=A0A2U1KX41_ARTAN|nr:nonaspanin (TM9SF), Major facilitator superfamily domain protein [Artemisia annua]
MVGLPKVLYVTLVLICIGSQVESDASNHRYNKGDIVPFYANKVGPFHNPQETYAYYDLPFCSPETLIGKKLNLGEMLNGDRLVSAPYKLEFLVDKDFEVLCSKKLSKNDASQFKNVIKEDYYMQMYYDDLPVWGFIGYTQSDYTDERIKNKYFLFKHIMFEVFYNMDRFIEVTCKMGTDSLVDLTDNKEVNANFTYSVKWSVTEQSFDKRMEKYIISTFLPHHLSIHHHSIAYSSVAIFILIICLVTFYVLVLNKDISKNLNDVEDDQVDDNQEETGWKKIHGDVFRFPKHKSLFAAALVSYQFLLWASWATFSPMFEVYSGMRLSLHMQLRLWSQDIPLFLSTSNLKELPRTSKCPKEIPRLRWYRGLLPQMALAGILPFSVVYVQLYYIFATVWGHRVYTLYNIMFVVFIFLLITTALVSVALTYFQLAAEDHQWWWRSFFCGGSTGLYIYGYGIYYYFCRTDMTVWVSVPHCSLFATSTQLSNVTNSFDSTTYMVMMVGTKKLEPSNIVWKMKILLVANEQISIYRMAGLPKILFATLLLIYIGRQVESVASNHRYNKGDIVPFYANTVGLFANPRETYAYYDFPFCSPDTVIEKKLNLGEMLNGDRLVSAPYKLEFLVDKDSEVLCSKKLSKNDVSQFKKVIKEDYYMQMYYDDLPIWGFIGYTQRDYPDERIIKKYILFKHYDFNVFYNKDRVIEVRCRAVYDSFVDLTEDKEVSVNFTYSVKWFAVQNSFDERMENNLHSDHLLSDTLCASPSQRHFHDQAADNQEETGWKNIHGDVFRFPKHKSLFTASLGSGTHLLLLIVSILVTGLMGYFQPYVRGVFWNALVIAYAVTSIVSGYTSVSFYSQLEGTTWMKNLLLTGGLYSVPLVLTFALLNSVANFYGTTAALPLGAIIILSLLWIFVALPLLLLGGFIGKNKASDFQAACRTSKCPKEVLRLRWYRGLLPQMALAGILPYTVVYVQLYYILATVWGHPVYALYTIMSVVFILLLIITALVTVALTYFQLAAEDHQWWWRSDMTGFMQTSFFFGYMACVCYGIFLVLGSVGFRASLLFTVKDHREMVKMLGEKDRKLLTI